VPAAVFALIAVGYLVRLADTGRPMFLYGSIVATVLSISASAFAIVHATSLAIAGVLLFDHARLRGERVRTVVDRLFDAMDRTRGWTTPAARGMFVFLGTWFVLFAPRGRSWRSIEGFEALLVGTYVDPIGTFRAVRMANRDGHEFLPYVTDAIGTLLIVSGPVLLLAIGGFLADRYGYLDEAGGRPIVTLTALWGGIGLIAVPTLSEVSAPWLLVHVLVPLSVPAGVGLALLLRAGAAGVRDADTARITAVVLLVVAFGVLAGATVTGDVYGPSSSDNRLVQYAQPVDDIEAAFDDAAAVIEANTEGPDVLYVGERFDMGTEPSQPPIVPAADRAAFGERLPLPWYTERLGAETASVDSPADVRGDPPVVIADPRHRGELGSTLEGYDSREYRLALWDRTVVVYVQTG
ncbi:MAG: flippase activity-associated protein Agl23, partial [Halobacteriota archaeon]